MKVQFRLARTHRTIDFCFELKFRGVLCAIALYKADADQIVHLIAPFFS